MDLFLDLDLIKMSSNQGHSKRQRWESEMKGTVVPWSIGTIWIQMMFLVANCIWIQEVIWLLVVLFCFFFFVCSCIVVTCKLCHQTVPICSSLIKCTSKILYNLYTTPLTPNGPFLGSRFYKNEFKTRTFQETTMRIGNARYYGALIYRNYLDTDDVIGCRLCVFFVVCVFDWLILDSRLKICLTSNYGKTKIRCKSI